MATGIVGGLIGSAFASGLQNYLGPGTVSITQDPSTLGYVVTSTTDSSKLNWNNYYYYQPQQVMAQAMWEKESPRVEPEPSTILEKLRKETNRFCKDALVMA